MSTLEPKVLHKEILQYVSSYVNQKKPRNRINNMSLMVHKKTNNDHKEHKFADHNSNYNKHPTKCLHLSNFVSLIRGQPVIKRTSMPDMTNANKHTKAQETRNVISNTILKRDYNPSNSNYVLGVVSQQRFQDTSKFFNDSILKIWKVYRCQLITNRETCGCSYNSDAMFEVMKCLYDCYIMKNCDSCDCIICGHEYVEERRLGELNKSVAALGPEGKSDKEIEDTIVKAEKAMVGKTLAEKEIILKDLAMSGIPLPEGKTAAGNSLINKVRKNLGLPIAVTADDNCKMKKAAMLGLLQPLDGKTPKEKKKILTDLADMGIPLPEGRTASEKEIVWKVQAAMGLPLEALSERLRKAKAKGLLTPLEGKSPAEKEKVLRGLGMAGLPLPEGKTASERKLINTIRSNLGLPPEPKTLTMRAKYKHVAEAGLLHPLESKTPAEKKRIVQRFTDLGIPLPKGRTPSENILIAKVKKECLLQYCHHCMYLSKKGKAKAEGLLTPLQGKSPLEKENILKGLANLGMPFPAGTTDSERMLIDSIRTDLGLPPEPKTALMRDKYTKAADLGLLLPLEGKTPKQKENILRGLADLGIPLPECRTASEKALIATLQKVQTSSILLPSEKQTGKQRKAKAAAILTPLKGISKKQKQNIFKGLSNVGIPLPEGTIDSEKKLVNKIRTDLGLPPEPTTLEMNDKYKKAADNVLLLPLEGKSLIEKKDILQGLADMKIPLPERRTASEKSLITDVQRQVRPISILTPSEKMRRAKVARIITPLKRKTPAQRENILKGLAKMDTPLPKGTTDSEKKVHADLGLPPEPATAAMKDKHDKAANAGLLQPLEGKTPRKKDRIIRGLADMGIRMNDKYEKAADVGLLQPCKGKTAIEKDRILHGLADFGIALPEGRTLSEKSLIAKVQKKARVSSLLTPLEKMQQANTEGLLTPLEGKTPKDKERILKGLDTRDIPQTEGKLATKKKLVETVRAELGLQLEPTTREMRDIYEKAADSGVLHPLENKFSKERKLLLRGIINMEKPLPDGRTASIKSLIAKVQKEARPLSVIAVSKNIRKAKPTGLKTPLKDKTPTQKENILKGLGNLGIAFPERKRDSGKSLTNKVLADFGLPPTSVTPEMNERYANEADVALLQPLAGKSPDEKAKVLRGLADMGIPLPEGRRLPSQKGLVEKFKTIVWPPSVTTVKLRKTKEAGLLTPLARKPPKEKDKNIIPKDLANIGLLLPKAQTSSERNTTTAPKKTKAERFKDAKAAGFISPLTSKTPEQKEKITRGLANAGLPLLKTETPPEKILIEKIYADTGLPPELKAPSMKEKYMKAKAEELIIPLEGKHAAEKEAILKKPQLAGIPDPESRTPGEKSLIKIIKARTPSQRLKAAKEAGVLTHIEGKSAKEKENLLLGLVEAGVTLPKGRTSSMKETINKVSYDMSQPSEAETKSMKNKIRRAAASRLVKPLEGKTLPAQADMRIPLSEGRRLSEKTPIEKIKNKAAEKLGQAKFAGLFIPLEGKSPADEEKFVSGLAEVGLPLPEGRTLSGKYFISKVKVDCGIAPSVTTPSKTAIVRKAKAKGLLTPITGETLAQKEKYFEVLLKLGCRYLNVRRYQKEIDKKNRAKVGEEEAKLIHSEREDKFRKGAKGIETVSKNLVKGIEAIAKEIEDIVKTTVCDRACGCNKKKIRFKRSYFKIRITSPCVSSSCPEECIPGAKNGDFVDNEGIKVTGVSVIGVSSYSREHTSTVSIRENNITNGKTKSYRYSPVRTNANFVPRKSYNKPNSGTYLGAVYSNLIQRISNTYSYDDFYSDRHVDYASSFPNFSHLATRLANYYSRKAKSSEDSMTSILIVTSDSTLTLSSDGSIDSIVSYTDDSYSGSAIEDSDYITDEINYSTEDSTESNISLRIDQLASITCTESEPNTFGSNKRSEFIILFDV